MTRSNSPMERLPSHDGVMEMRIGDLAELIERVAMEFPYTSRVRRDEIREFLAHAAIRFAEHFIKA